MSPTAALPRTHGNTWNAAACPACDRVSEMSTQPDSNGLVVVCPHCRTVLEVRDIRTVEYFDLSISV